MKNGFLYLFSLTIMSCTLSAQHGLSLEFYSGLVTNIPAPLTIVQTGEPEIGFLANYSTRPFREPFYYVIKLGFTWFRMNWQIQFIHHKLYLSNPPLEIQHFEITHGFNLLSINKLFDFTLIDFLIGGGLVLPHTESEVRNKKYFSDGGMFHSGYGITGPVVLLGLGKKIKITNRIYFSLEGQLTGAIVKVSIAEGRARVTNISIHGLFGFGYHF